MRPSGQHRLLGEGQGWGGAFLIASGHPFKVGGRAREATPPTGGSPASACQAEGLTWMGVCGLEQERDQPGRAPLLPCAQSRGPAVHTPGLAGGTAPLGGALSLGHRSQLWGEGRDFEQR